MDHHRSCFIQMALYWIVVYQGRPNAGEVVLRAVPFGTKRPAEAYAMRVRREGLGLFTITVTDYDNNNTDTWGE